MSYLLGNKILVTGGNGFLGSFVVDHLVDDYAIPRDSLRVPKLRA